MADRKQGIRQEAANLTTMRRAILTAILLLILVPGFPAHAAECGGFAPVANECSFQGQLAADNDLIITVGPVFTGRVVVTIATATGTYTGECTFLPLVAYECRSSQTGVQIPGQTYTLTARTGLGLPDREVVRGLAAGRWLVTYQPAT